MDKKIFILFFFINSIFVEAQNNLVPNGDFEAMADTFCNAGPIDGTPPWQNPSGGSPDCFKTCCIYQPDFLIPQNLLGYQYAHSGEGYAGFMTYCPLPVNAREYIQIKLTDSLKTNKKYFVNFYVSLADSGTYATDKIGLYFSDTAIHKSIYDYSPFSSFTPQIENPHNNIITDKAGWTLISGTYTAYGGDQYITIGNFYDDANTNTLFVDGSQDSIHYSFSYYYIDDVSITLIGDSVPPAKPDNIFIPEAFSPNGDLENDILYVCSNNIKEMDFYIYNRWGEKVFESRDINKGWNGRYKNELCHTGVFVYWLRATLIDGEEVIKKGNVTLVR
ncbi:MAG: gliding motility-associated C-terminal domain-containing protein [Bacteroidetes bacterium]|nr:gliding motility-associated C-terminal domain-containing protein [Bacteroidota bacterium]